jgi:diaminopimelate epimerase
MRFTKMNGAGNDFVVVDNRADGLTLDPAQIARLCDRQRGIGADGLLMVESAQGGADFRMRYYNADGGEAEMCGNGARCFARYARRFTPQAGELSFETPAGVIRARFEGEQVAIRMSDPHSWAGPRDLDLAGHSRTVHAVNTGVPHAVAFVEDLDAVDVTAEGRALRFHPAFAPAGTNANFAQVLGPDSLALRTYERGVEGETLACGTGVCAAALIHASRSGGVTPVFVRVRGGETLRVAFRREGDATTDVILTGPADFVFEGEISL